MSGTIYLLFELEAQSASSQQSPPLETVPGVIAPRGQVVPVALHLPRGTSCPGTKLVSVSSPMHTFDSQSVSRLQHSPSLPKPMKLSVNLVTQRQKTAPISGLKSQLSPANAIDIGRCQCEKNEIHT